MKEETAVLLAIGIIELAFLAGILGVICGALYRL